MMATALGGYENADDRFQTTNQAFAKHNFGVNPVTMVDIWREGAIMAAAKEAKTPMADDQVILNLM